MKLSLSSTTYTSLLIAGSYLLSSSQAAKDSFNSNQAIILAQIQDPPIETFVICPDSTTIKIGLPANAADFTLLFAGGDFPLTVLHSDAEIRCDDDGDSTNNYALNGGFV
jgi:hypothetical protein